MEPQQTHFLDDLRSLAPGVVRADELTRAAYSTDASLLEVRPLAVALPKTTDQVCDILRLASTHGVAVHARGAGSGLAGESLGSGVILDTARHLDRILEIRDGAVRVQPGVRLATLNHQLAKSGQVFGPDPFSGDRCTLGGMIGSNAGGPHSLRYGLTGDNLLSLKVALADGTIREFRRDETDADPSDLIVPALLQTLRTHQAEIRKEQPAGLLKMGGYPLRDLLHPGGVDVARLFAGSEGTLAIILEAELKTVSLPKYRDISLTSFTSIEAAVHAGLASLECEPSSCELVDRRLLALARDDKPAFRSLVAEPAEAVLIIEVHADQESTLRERRVAISEKIGKLTGSLGAVHWLGAANVELAWSLRRASVSRLGQKTAGPQPLPFVENTSAPPKRLPQLLRRLQDIMKRHGVAASFSGHIGLGILHTLPMVDARRPDYLSTLAALAHESLQAVLECGGSNNGEHGVGLLRSGFLPRQYPRLYPVFRKIKKIFDPKNILNPGKIVDANPGFPVLLLRAANQPTPAEQGHLPILQWDEISLQTTARHCNGCAACRVDSDSVRMCPTFKAQPNELAAPRSKANLMRQILTGQLDPKTLTSDAFRDVADLCVHCKMCKLECPSGVDVSKLMLEAKAAHVAENGLNWSRGFFAGIDGWAKWASGNARMVNLLLSSRFVRFWMARVFGLSRRRSLPRITHRTFLRRAVELGWTKPPTASGRKVALLVDTFANYFDPELAETSVRVLQKAGVAVYVPKNQGPSGMAPLSQGDVETARQQLKHNLDLFAELAREGYAIVSTEPSAILMFRDEAKNLVSDPDLPSVTQQAFEIGEYMAILAAEGDLPAMFKATPLSVAYHEPCHQRALGQRASLATLLNRIPGLRLRSLDLGCSGMAGLYGMRESDYADSLKAGEAVLSRIKENDVQTATTQCSACRLQIEQATGKAAIHPIRLLALACGELSRDDVLKNSAIRQRRRQERG